MNRLITLTMSLLLLCGVSANSQIDSIAAAAEVSLLTCKSGDELYSTFGHTALRVRNPINQSDIVFNYGVFDFDTPYFYFKFVRGQLPYKLAATTMERFLLNYNYEQRSVIEQKLSLTPKQKAALLTALAENIKPENAEYKYDFFFDNCTTRTEDVIRSITGAIEYPTPLQKITFRQMLKENLQSQPWSEFGIDLIIGAVADRTTNRSEQHFLPLYLREDMKTATIVTNKARTNLTSTDYLVLDFDLEDEQRRQPATNWPLIIAAVLLAVELLLWFVKPSASLISIYDKVWYVLMSILAVVMAFMWWGTDHLATKTNYNLLWANLLFIPYLLVKNKIIQRLLTICLIAGSAVAFVNALYQFLPQYFLLSFGILAMISIIKLGRNQWQQGFV